MAVVSDGIVALANDAFARALGTSAADAAGKRLGALLPPEDGAAPGAGVACSYRTRLGSTPARVDLSPAPTGGAALAVLTPLLEVHDTAADRALLALSRELAEARGEDQVTAALARALEVLFPGRPFCIRLVDPKTLALSTLYARGRLRPQRQAQIALRRAAARRVGLPEAALEAGGIELTDRDVPLFERCDAANAVPLAVAGALFGVVNLEYERGAPGDPESDAPLLYQVANHAALGVRNVRSLEELTYLKTYLEDLLEHANALITVVRRDRAILVWNAALVRLTGIERDAALGTDLRALAPDDARAALDAVLERSFAGEAVNGFETRLSRAGRGEVRLAVNTAPIVGSSGDVEGVIAIGQDVTPLRSLEAAAEHAERLAGIGRLVAGVVHELNNPLTAVTMYSDALLEKLALAGQDPADLEKLRAIKESGLRIQRLARDLVSYARPSGTRVEAVDLAAVIDEAARMAKPALKESSAVLERRLDAVPPVEGNRASLVQVFVNLVTNAAQALAEGGKVTLGLALDGARIVATVADDGAGMPPEVASRAFEPFFTTRPGRGIGLGLPIVHEIVQRHGGTIAVESAPGRGTTVAVALPVRREPAQPGSESTA